MTTRPANLDDERFVMDADVVEQAAEAFLREGFRRGFGPSPSANGGPLAYGFHPLYHDLAGRGQSVALHGASGAFAVMPMPPYASIEAPDGGVCVLRPEITHAGPFWESLRSVAQSTGLTIVVKSVCADEAAEALATPGVRAYRDHERWSPVARWDEQSFPEVVLDLQRRGVQSPSSPDLRFEECSAVEAVPIGRQAAEQWMGWYLLRRPEFPRADLESYYDHALRAPAVAHSDFRFAGFHADKPVAFAYASRITDRQVDIWVCLAAGEPPLLSRAFFGYLRQYFGERGFLFVGLGGSELRSLYHFKRRLAGRLLLRRTHLVVEA